MVYYLLVVSPRQPPTPCPSSGVYEQLKDFKDAHAEAIVDVLQVGAIKIFRAIGAGANLEDALPIQRTSALLLVAAPSELSPEALEDFLDAGSSLFSSGIEAMRVLQGGAKSPGFFTAVLLCRSQAAADALYKANHGRLFKGEDSSDQGPCCYLAFLEAIVYTEASSSSSSDPCSDTSVIPSTAYEIPSCPVCIERIDVSGTGMVTHSHGWIGDKRPPCCVACAVICDASAEGGTESGLRCECCQQQEDLWACLICGHLGCGRYKDAHAKDDHATERRHRFCFQLASGRIWDYHSDVFVHRRLVQQAAASGRRFELALPAPAIGSETSKAPGTTAPGNEQLLSMESWTPSCPHSWTISSRATTAS
ncbi:unnamed protein product [Effrenium voratum]|nr:unnamed protein product [Effrenium voratum]